MKDEGIGCLDRAGRSVGWAVGAGKSKQGGLQRANVEQGVLETFSRALVVVCDCLSDLVTCD